MTRDAVALVGTLEGDAALMVHTGDLSHLSRDAQFDAAARIIGGAGLKTHYVPGRYDIPDVEAAPLAESVRLMQALGGGHRDARGSVAPQCRDVVHAEVTVLPPGAGLQV